MLRCCRFWQIVSTCFRIQLQTELCSSVTWHLCCSSVVAFRCRLDRFRRRLTTCGADSVEIFRSLSFRCLDSRSWFVLRSWIGSREKGEGQQMSPQAVTTVGPHGVRARAQVVWVHLDGGVVGGKSLLYPCPAPSERSERFCAPPAPSRPLIGPSVALGWDTDRRRRDGVGYYSCMACCPA